MSKKFLIVLAILIVSIFVITKKGSMGNLVNPQSAPTFVPTLAAPVAPKTFNFDSSTDLKTELEKVNPQILDSDF